MVRSCAFFLLAMIASPMVAQDNSHLEAVLASYERVRLALAADSLEGVEGAAREMATRAEVLARAVQAAVDKEDKEAVSDAASVNDAGEVAAAAKRLAVARDLAAARDAFYAASMPLVRLDNTFNGSAIVAYCSMAKRSWLQPPGLTLGNPYYGQSMPTCGEVVTP